MNIEIFSVEEIAFEIIREMDSLSYLPIDLIKKVAENRCRRVGLDNKVLKCWEIVNQAIQQMPEKKVIRTTT